MGLYRLCLGKTSDAKTGYSLLIPMLNSLLSFLEEALTIKPQKILDVGLVIVNGGDKLGDA